MLQILGNIFGTGEVVKKGLDLIDEAWTSDEEKAENATQNHRIEAVKFIVESILNDAQSRLSFRAQEYIQSEIRIFKPREKELMVLARGPDLPQPTTLNFTTMTILFLKTYLLELNF